MSEKSENRSIHVFGPVNGMLPGHILYQDNIPEVRMIIFIAVVAKERDFDSIMVGSLLDIQWVFWSLVHTGCGGSQKAVVRACHAGRL